MVWQWQGQFSCVIVEEPCSSAETRHHHVAWKDSQVKLANPGSKIQFRTNKRTELNEIKFSITPSKYSLSSFNVYMYMYLYLSKSLLIPVTAFRRTELAVWRKSLYFHM